MWSRYRNPGGRVLSQPNRNTNQDEKDQEILFDKDNWNSFGGDQDNGDEDYLEFSIIVILELSCISVKKNLNFRVNFMKTLFWQVVQAAILNV